MSAQDFHGVTFTANWHTIINQSDKPILGWALQARPITRYNPAHVFVDLNSLAAGKLIQPGEERPIPVFKSLAAEPEEEAITGFELKGVLFVDGMFYGPGSVFQDFSSRISMTRSLARDMQDAGQVKYRLMEQDKQQATPRAMLDAMRRGASSQDFQKFDLESNIAAIILSIRDSKAEQAAEAALAKIAALPDVVRGR